MIRKFTNWHISHDNVYLYDAERNKYSIAPEELIAVFNSIHFRAELKRKNFALTMRERDGQTFVTEGVVVNSQYMYDIGSYELMLDTYDNNALNPLIDFCNKHEGKKITLRVEVENDTRKK
jgi:hypothetical protein